MCASSIATLSLTAGGRNISPSSSMRPEADRSRLAFGEHPRRAQQSARRNSCRRTSWLTAPAKHARQRAELDGEFPQGPWLARRHGTPAGRSQLRRHPGMECRFVYQAIALMGRQIDGGEGASRRCTPYVILLFRLPGILVHLSRWGEVNLPTGRRRRGPKLRKSGEGLLY